MTTPIIPAVPAHVPLAVLPSASPALLSSHTPIANTAFQSPISPGSVRNCIRLRGMPYSANVEDIVAFLGEYSLYILPHGVHMVLNQQGRASGDAFVQLSSVEKAALAGMDVSKGGCHKKHMGERYVEVFQCSGDEMNMVLMGGTLNRNGVSPPPGLVCPEASSAGVIQTSPLATCSAAPIQTPIFLQPQQGAVLMQHALVAPPSIPTVQHLDLLQAQTFLTNQRTASVYSQISQPAVIPFTQYLPTPPISPNNPPTGIPIAASLPGFVPSLNPSNQDDGSGNHKTQVRVQGLPYNITVSAILDFFGNFELDEDSVKLLYNEKLYPAGEALISFKSFQEAHRAVVEKNRKILGNHIVELFFFGS